MAAHIVRCALKPMNKTKALLLRIPEPIRLQGQRWGGHGPRQMPFHPSGFYWNTMKNELHYYTWLGFIPTYLFWAYHNFFVGQAELRELPDPEEYIPEEYEYYKHPISRLWIRMMGTNKQKRHERTMAYCDSETAKLMIINDYRRFENLMIDNEDFISYYYVPISKKYTDEVWEYAMSPDALARSKTRSDAQAPF